MAVSGKDTLRGLEGRAEKEEGEDDKVQPREFFWDSIVQVAVYSILALTAVEAIFEFIRGEPGVQCLTPSSASDREGFINGLCYAYIPVAQYFTVFMFIHGLSIGIPHSLWGNYHAGSLRFFFHRASSLERQTDPNTGKYPESNDTIVNQLVTVFDKYERNNIYLTYILKLVLQWVLTAASFVVGIVYFTDFSEVFHCPSTVNETLTNIAWPLPGEQIVCVFSTLRILYLLRVVDLVLLAIILLFLTLSFIWCLKPHSMELGTDSVAAFSFQSGLDPSTHTSSPFALRGPRIRSDLDFMVVKLFRTDGDLGHVFNEVRILWKIKELDQEDNEDFDLYKRGQSTGEEVLGKESKSDMKWSLKGAVITGFSPVHFSEKLFVPDSIRGAVLGFGARAPANSLAVYISFGSPSSGLANSLARLFYNVLWFNFTPFSVGEPEKTESKKKEPEQKETEAQPPAEESGDAVKSKARPGDEEKEEVKAKMSVKSTGVTSLVAEDDIFLTDLHKLKLVQLLTKFFVPPNDDDDAKEANFVLVGPVDSKKQSKSLDHLLTEMTKTSNRFIADGALLLYLRPRRIGRKSVEPFFQPYTPPKCDFVPVKYHQVAVLGRELEETEWPPKDIRSEPRKTKDNTKLQEKKTADQLKENKRREAPTTDNESTRDQKKQRPKPIKPLSPEHPILSVLVGRTDVKFEFAMYSKGKVDDDQPSNAPRPPDQPSNAPRPPDQPSNAPRPPDQPSNVPRPPVAGSGKQPGASPVGSRDEAAAHVQTEVFIEHAPAELKGSETKM